MPTVSQTGSDDARQRAGRARALFACVVALAGPLWLSAGCPEEVATCEVAEDCSANQVCWQGLCRLVCNDKFDCAAGETCSNGVCLPALDSGAGRDRAEIGDASSDASPPDRSAADAREADVRAPDIVPPDAAAIDTAVSDTAAPDAAAPDTAAPDRTAPDTAAPDTAAPDTAAPDLSLPDVCIPEICDGLDNDCDGVDDNGCDNDGDDYCDANLEVVGVPAVCPLSAPGTGDDCDDTESSVNPDGSEGPGRNPSCHDGDDNDCNGFTDMDDFACQSDPTWWDVAWARRRPLTFLNSSRDEDMVDFPVLVHINMSAYAVGEFSTDGADIRFVDADDSTLLAHEIERWDEYAADIWVKVPKIDKESDTDFIWFYYRNPSAADAQQVSAVWTDGFAAVWHMSQDPNTSAFAILDSTANANHGMAVDMESGDLVPGAVGMALSFDDTCEHVRVPSVAGDALELGARDYTIEVWARRGGETGDYMCVVGRQLGDHVQDSYLLGARQSDIDEAIFSSSPDDCLTAADTPFALDTWNYVVAFRDTADVARVFKNGELLSSCNNWNDATSYDDNDVVIGAQENDPDTTVSECWHGLIDEVRLSTTTRRRTWQQAQLASMTGNLVVIGGSEDL